MLSFACNLRVKCQGGGWLASSEFPKGARITYTGGTLEVPTLQAKKVGDKRPLYAETSIPLVHVGLSSALSALSVFPFQIPL